MQSIRVALARLGEFQTLLSIPATWNAVSVGAAVVLTATASLEWHWKLLLFLTTSVALMVAVHVLYATVLYGRIVKTRAVRALLCDAGKRLAAAAVTGSPGNARQAAEKVIFMAHCDVLLLFALKPTVVRDYDYSISVMKDRAQQRKVEFDPMPAKAAYISALGERLSFEMIDPGFYPPENLDEFLKNDVVFV